MARKWSEHSIGLIHFEGFGPLFIQQHREAFHLALTHFLITLEYDLAFSPSISMIWKAKEQEED